MKKYSKEEALKLRGMGFTYTEISTQMGCSVAWCKKALVGHEKGVDKVERLVVDGTKLKAIELVEEMLARLKLL